MILHLVGELLNIVGRQVERGNTRAAAVGAAIAGPGGGIWMYRVGDHRPWDGGWIALAVVVGAAAAMAGALVGSFVRPRAAAAEPWRAAAEPWNAGVRPGKVDPAAMGPAAVVRATNYSRALAPTILCVLVWSATAAVGIAVAPEVARNGRQLLDDVTSSRLSVAVLAFVAFLALLTVASVRAVYWADLGRQIVVRRLFSSTTYGPEELAGWQFLESESVESVWLELRLGRRRPIQVAVRRADLPKAEAILRRLSATAVRGGI